MSTLVICPQANRDEWDCIGCHHSKPHKPESLGVFGKEVLCTIDTTLSCTYLEKKGLPVLSCIPFIPGFNMREDYL